LDKVVYHIKKYENQPELDVSVENSLVYKTQVDVIIQDLPDGVEQSQITKLHYRTLSETAKLKDWQITFQDVLSSMERWGFNVPQ